MALQNKHIFLFSFLGIGLLVFAVFLYFPRPSQKPLESSEIHFHAGFQVYVDDQLQDFSDFKYMNTKPCSLEDIEEDEQKEKAHLHDRVGDVLHAHRNGGTYADLFQNINYTVPPDLVGYINGQQVPQVMNMQIVPNSSAVFFVGDNTDIERKVQDRVSQDHIKEIEVKSEDCGK